MSDYRTVLRDLVPTNCEVVATIDHPYTTPPVHVLDGHLRILRQHGHRALILNWDVSFPEDRRYRYDLITDTGLLMKNRHLYHYDVDKAYADQSVDPTPWAVMPSCVSLAVPDICSNLRLPQATASILTSRANDVLNLTTNAYTAGVEPWELTRNVLSGYYELFGCSDLAAFIRSNYSAFSRSEWQRAWIPWCIDNVTGRLALDQVLNSGIFERQPFRAASGRGSLTQFEIGTLAQDISLGNVAPSFEVFLWSLAVGGISHYGNDRGFLERLSKVVGNPAVAALQLTNQWEDCKRFVQIAYDFGVPVNVDEHGTTSVVKGPRNRSKLTRITSMGALFVCMGERSRDLVNEYSEGEFDARIIELAP